MGKSHIHIAIQDIRINLNERTINLINDTMMVDQISN